MLPSVLSRQIEQGVKDFLRTTFQVTTPFFHGVVDQLLDREEGVFKGPYLSLQLPFLRHQPKERPFPDVVKDGFRPFVHQQKSFERLKGPDPQHTIVATGTGSGKTECFLYPVLDWCYQNRGQTGIKAILIYPMNALANDQATRIAKLIWDNPNLKGNVTAGLYVGQREKHPHQVMGEGSIITDKETLRLSPPDILLTNYKMLDFLLIRPIDAPLWALNTPETLRFLVVDELHTFDGAQGTDLACLIRRLKARLGTPQGHLCCVGTSATLGGEQGADDLIQYASSVFGESIPQDALITESRMHSGDFLKGQAIQRSNLVPESMARGLDPEESASYEAYIKRQAQLWLGEDGPVQPYESEAWRLDLGHELMGHVFFQNLLKTLRGRLLSYEEILQEIERIGPFFKELNKEHRILLLNSLLALVAEARFKIREENGSEEPQNVEVRHQLWLRELRRMVCSVDPQPELTFVDDLTEEQRQKHLPLAHCRECGSMGWIGLQKAAENRLTGNLQDIYVEFFKDHSTKLRFLFPEAEGGASHPEGQLCFFCTSCMHLSFKEAVKTCPLCGGKSMVRAFLPPAPSHACPFCGAHNSLTLLGSRAASLTSVMISQLYASAYNEHKKLITFSDNVQDAAHRAGFFAARTYRFNLRAAMQRFLQEGGEGLHLEDFGKRLNQYWRHQLDEGAYVATFLAPNMAWFQDYDYLKEHGRLPKGSRLLEDIRKRLQWEVYSQYCFDARIGRTLEKSGASIAHLSKAMLEEAAEEIHERLINEVGELRDLSKRVVLMFLQGLLLELKNQGAVFIPVLSNYVQKWGNTYLISQRHIPWMQSIGQRTRAPSFLTTKQDLPRFDALFSKNGRPKTWYEVWALKCLGSAHPLPGEVIPFVYDKALGALTGIGILEERIQENHRVWGLLPAAFLVEEDPEQVSCDACGHEISVHRTERSDWIGAPCMRRHCQGTYQHVREGLDYYGRLYARGDIQRLFAAEHTGLLKRDERRELEAAFKAEKDRKPWHPNLLSCTPTLEMGIDIGSLSSTIQCSVPPSAASYLQRIGRSGRRDGNAVNVTVANGNPHDLYFYAQPSEMLEGKISPPGVFLNASAVLERQLTAFCFDRWVQSGATEADLPIRIGGVLSRLGKGKETLFPFSFLLFIENHQSEIFGDFVSLFEDGLVPETVASLEIFMQGDKNQEGSLSYKILEGLIGLNKERNSLRNRIRRLHKLIKKKETDPAKDKNHEEELEELIREKEALQKLVQSINDRNTFNFFTDEGLLPNYTFPEAGVLLRSVVYRKNQRAGKGDRKYETMVFDYERAAQSAISELAPSNTFYAGGRRVVVDQIDMGVSSIEVWRLCDHCSHMELGGDETSSACSGCGSLMWSDQGRKQELVRMRQVFATTPDSQSRIGDDSDDRDPAFYNRRMLLDSEEGHITAAYKAEDESFPFGFEFVSRAVFREINFGPREDGARVVSVAGEDIQAGGFSICRYCGKVQRGKKAIHALDCSAKDPAAEKNFMETVYLYREFASEAIKILLPVTTFSGSDEKLHSFIAALHLGLKRKFKGNIDHLQTMHHREPVSDSLVSKQYLVLFDTVPGGTGYIKQLMRQQTLMEVFQTALDALQSCPCGQDPKKDGCYSCLYAYRNSYTMAETSRKTAIALLTEILAHRDRMVAVSDLKSIPVGALLDSELEARFLEALRRLSKKGISVSLSKNVVHSKPGFFLQIDDHAYDIELQAELGHAEGVAVPSRADFVFHPVRDTENSKPIVVFTDGYAFHKNRIAEDTAQRLAILRSGKYHVWSLAWKDVEHQFHSQGDYFVNYLHPNGKPSGGKFDQLWEGYGLKNGSKVHPADSFRLFVRLLRKPEVTAWQMASFVQAMVYLDLALSSDEKRLANWLEDLGRRLPDNVMGVFEGIGRDSLYGHIPPQEGASNEVVNLHCVFGKKALNPPDGNGGCAVCQIDDTDERIETQGFEAAWIGFLRLMNVFQFLPKGYFLSRKGLEKGLYGFLTDSFDTAQRAALPDSGEDLERGMEGLQTSQGWREALEMTEPMLHSLLRKLQEAGWPSPEPGFELSNEGGVVLGAAELSWPERRLALLSPQEMAHASAFQDQGWEVLSLEDVLREPETLINMQGAREANR